MILHCKTTKKEYQNSSTTKAENRKCMISGLSPMVEIPCLVQITVKGLERGTETDFDGF
jgi:hypothetical protein